MLQPTRTRSLSLLVVAVAVVLGACGSDKKAASPPKTTKPAAEETTTTSTKTTVPKKKALDPCVVVTKEQAQQVVGGAVLGDGVPTGATSEATLCQYTSDPNGPTAQVQVFTGDGAKKSLDIDKDTLGHPFETLTGIGDEAYLEDDNVWVRKGADWVQVNVVDLDLDEAQIRDGLKAVAATIVTQM